MIQDDNEISRSKRRYPERTCSNPICDFGIGFIPHDKRQKFCCVQCRVNFYNDQRYTFNNTIFKNEKRLRQYDKLLGKIYNVFVNEDDYCAVWKGIFQYERINVRLLVEEQQNIRTGGSVRWFYQYGTELHPKDKNYFLIHKKQSK